MISELWSQSCDLRALNQVRKYLKITLKMENNDVTYTEHNNMKITN